MYFVVIKHTSFSDFIDGTQVLVVSVSDILTCMRVDLYIPIAMSFWPATQLKLFSLHVQCTYMHRYKRSVGFGCVQKTTSSWPQPQVAPN